MKFLDDNFLLSTKTSQRLYHAYAKDMPIIDYHCHLPPDQIANDIQLISQMPSVKWGSLQVARNACKWN